MARNMNHYSATPTRKMSHNSSSGNRNPDIGAEQAYNKSRRKSRTNLDEQERKLRPATSTVENGYIKVEKSRLENPHAEGGEDEAPELLTRTAWVDARTALDQMRKGKITGNKGALWIRAKCQDELYKLGKMAQIHPGKILFVGILILATFCVGFKSAKFETKMEKLWAQEGGRLQHEIAYVESQLGSGAGSTSQMVIQTPREDTGINNVLTPEALLDHLEVLKAATKVVVEKDDVAWEWKDLCYAQTIPTTETFMVDQILENLFPCTVITPLDCFWEGSELLGRGGHPTHIPLGSDEGSMVVSWSTLNPMDLLRRLRETSFAKHFNFDSFEEFMKRAGITSGYQEKPCLNPANPDCPITAPNKHFSTASLDVGAELTGGCYGFATRYNHWPEQLIVGGADRNRTGHIQRAKAVQSVVQLMGEKDLYDYYSDTYKVHTLDWSPEKAAEILSLWQSKFSAEAARISKLRRIDKKFEVSSFSDFHLESVLESFSEFDPVKLAAGYLLMLAYAAASFYRIGGGSNSRAGAGAAGVALVTLAMAAGLGACALLGVRFNATTSQIVPFLALGLGVDGVFMLAHNYGLLLLTHQRQNVKESSSIIGDVLKRSGISVALTTTCNIAAFLCAAVIPIPALRSFSLQAAVLSAFNLFAVLGLYPAVLALDFERCKSNLKDLFCCYPQDDEEKAGKANVLASKIQLWNFSEVYANYAVNTPLKLTATIVCLALTSVCVWGAFKVEDGLYMKDVVPRNTSIYKFLKAQDEYFGFYNMYAVTQGHFEYPQNQKLIYDYHNAFVRVPNIIKDDDGGLPEFWLPLFRTWLLKMQTAFDDNYARGTLNEDGWFKNASDDAVLGFKLMVQTGHVDYPTDMTLFGRNRLVDSHGMINPAAFYNYLSAWYTNDPMAYSFSQAAIRPTPKEWFHDARDYDLKIPKSKPISYAQIPFYLNDLGDTDIMVETIGQIRDICDKFSNQGLPNFPRGIPFTYWEQYLTLRFWLLATLAAILAVIFAVCAFVFMSCWAGGMAASVLALLLLQLFGALGILDIKLSAVPAVILIMAAGIGVQFTMHIVIGFLTAVGNKNRRVFVSLKNMLSPVFHGAASTFLGIFMLAFSNFDFVFRYFFLVLTALIILGAFNGLVFLPVLLAFVGPPADVIPGTYGLSASSNAQPNSIAPPTPELPKKRPTSSPLRKVRINSTAKNAKAANAAASSVRRAHSDVSLSTIAEESRSHYNHNHSTSESSSSEASSVFQDHSVNPAASILGSSLNGGGGASVFVEPHVVVETTTYPSSQNSSISPSPTPQVTKVTATAKFKVEVHTPTSQSLELPSQQQRPSSSRSRRSSRSNQGATSKVDGASAADGGAGLTSVSLSDSLKSSLADSLKASLSSTDSSGDPGFCEK